MARPRLLPCIRSQRRAYLLLFAGFFISVCIMNLTISALHYQRSSKAVKDDILSLSRLYIKKLAEENGDVVDGPYAGRYTGFDLKQTLAVLLDSILSRVDRLENRVDNLTSNYTNLRQVLRRSPRAQSSPDMESLHSQKKIYDGSEIDAQKLITGDLPDCSIPPYSEVKFPSCAGKIEYMQRMWQTDPCYAHYGVDGSNCSIVFYLSEVENWCPRLSWRQKAINKNQNNEKATFPTDKKPLLDMLTDDTDRFGFVKHRIEEGFDRWVAAFKKLELTQKMDSRLKKKVILHMSLLMKGSIIRNYQTKGGPLGELVQWSDLIITLYLLGHDIRIITEKNELSKYIDEILGERRWRSCPSRGKSHVDLIYTDINGLRILEAIMKSNLHQLRCLLRIVDSFGTEPAFNYAPYASQHKLVSSWGKHNLWPMQFFTMFPHSPDNSFMGFVIPDLGNHSSNTLVNRTNRALVYGKRKEFWQSKRHYLDVLNEVLELHGTVYHTNQENISNLVPEYVINHGLLKFDQLVDVLRSSKIFVGMGFPYEGPAPLEAISAGCVVLQPKFNPPHNSQNNNFFKGKPTLRDITSQHPYIENFIGEPHAYTIDINNDDEVRKTVKKILNNPPVVGYMPFEFTEQGMIQRMNAYIERQDFCQGLENWVPSSAVTIELGPVGKSCKMVCQEKGLWCEPSHFQRINNETFFAQAGIKCSSMSPEQDTYYPAYRPTDGLCIVQTEPLLFSCVTQRSELQRLCPCRDFIRGQTALCHSCLL